MTSALHWEPIGDGGVACDLCYRRCVIEDGAAGFCRVRANEGGVMVLRDYGVVSNCHEIALDHGPWGAPLMLMLGGISCTSRCSFCTSRDAVHHPDRLPLIDPSTVPINHFWQRGRVPQTADDIVQRALAKGATGLWLSYHEWTMTPEYLADVSERTRHAGLWLKLDTNGFTGAGPVATIAPLVDAVYVGTKGHLSESFYTRHMRSPGASEAVRAALLAWHHSGVSLAVSDLVTPPKWLEDDDAAANQMRRHYGWIAANLGRDVHLDLWKVLDPSVQAFRGEMRPILPAVTTRADVEAYEQRHDLAERVARECGLRNVHLRRFSRFSDRWINA